MFSNLNVCAAQHSAVKMLALRQLGGVLHLELWLLDKVLAQAQLQLCVITLSIVIDPANTINPD